MASKQIDENDKPLPEKKFIQDLATQTAFGALSLEQVFKRFKKKYSNELYAQKSFESVVHVSMVEGVDVEHSVTKFFMENDVEKIKLQPFRIRGKLTEQDENEKWKAELYIVVYDHTNPGVEMTDTIKIVTTKTIKKEALDEMNEMATSVMKDMMKKMGRSDGTVLNMLTGKAL